MAIVSISAPSSTSIGTSVTVTAQVANKGTQNESITVTLTSAFGEAGPAQNISLAAGGAGSVSFTWTAPKKKQNHVNLRVATLPLDGEKNREDNKDSVSIKVVK